MRNAVTEESLVELGSEILRIPSFKGEESALAQWLAEYFDDRDYDVELQTIAPGRQQTIARLRGRGDGRNLMLNGHLDIDPLRAGWKRDPFVPVAEGGLLYGAGVRNMKAGVTSMILAAEAIRLSDTELAGDLTIACVAGELQGGVGTTYALRKGLTADAAIVPEPFGAHNLVTTTSGVLEFAVSTYGFSEHISRKDSAVDAVSMMLPVIDALNHVEFDHKPHADLPDLPRLVVGGIVGGRGPTYDMSGPNYTPDRCTITVDVRYVPGQTRESVLSDVRRAIDDVRTDHPELVYDISFESHPPYVLNEVVFEPSEVPVTEPVISLVADAYSRTTGTSVDNVGAVLPYSYCGADTAHLWRAGIPCVLYGPTGPAQTSDHPDDCASIEEMKLVTRVITDSILRFCT